MLSFQSAWILGATAKRACSNASPSSCNGGEGGIDSAPSASPLRGAALSAASAPAPKRWLSNRRVFIKTNLTPIKQQPHKWGCCFIWRRGWDSNPRGAYAPNGFRIRAVMATSVPLQAIGNGVILCSIARHPTSKSLANFTLIRRSSHRKDHPMLKPASIVRRNRVSHLRTYPSHAYII